MQNKISERFKCNCTSESKAYATGTYILVSSDCHTVNAVTKTVMTQVMTLCVSWYISQTKIAE